MAKRERRSIVDLMGKDPLPDLDVVEEGVKTIHQAAPPKQPKPKPIKEKLVRVTVDTPVSLHKALKKIVIEEDLDLKRFYLLAVREKCERLGYKLPE